LSFVASVLAGVLFASSVWAAPGGFVISGRGYGHGEGLSQWGAWEAAREGVKYDAILAFYYPGTTLTQVSSTQTVTVRLTKSSSSDCYYRVDLHPTTTSATLVMHDSIGDQTQTLAAGTVVETLYSGGKVQVVGTTGTFDWVELRPASTDGRVALSLWAASSTTSAYNIEYWGTLRVEPNTSAGALQLFNTLLLDRYARDVSEIDPGWADANLPNEYAPECVKAQQTAARTYALAKGAATLYDDTRDQVYGGYTYEAAHPGVAASADATAGTVITYAGKPITANFSTHSGGYLTDSAWSDNAGIPYLVAKPDPWSLSAPVPPWTISPGYPWTYTISPADLASKLGVSVGTITNVQVTERDTSDPDSHARSLLITGTTGSTTMAARTFKSKLGLKSTLILSITGGGTRYEQGATDANGAPYIVYEGVWNDFSKPGLASGDSYGRSLTKGASATICFTGTRLDWIATTGSTPGIVDVYLDDTYQKTVDLYSSPAAYQVPAWSTGTITDGPHKVELLRSDSSLATEYITLDAVDIWGTISDASPPLPAITGLNPASGSTASGTKVTIVGSNFTGATAVTFGGTPAVSYTVDSGTQITAVAPAHVAGTVPVQVTASGGTTVETSADEYTYVVASPTTRVDASSSNAAFVWSGTWGAYSKTSAYGGSYERSSTAGAYVVIPFNGTRLDWIGMKGTTTGMVDVYLDNVLQTTINLYTSTPVYQVNLWSTGNLPAGYHTVKLQNHLGSTQYVPIDAVDVAGSLVASKRFEQTDTHLVWTPSYATWTTGSSTSYSGGSIKYINKTGSVTINFTGVSLKVIAKKSTAYGEAKITLDGTTVFTISLYNSTTVYKQVAWSSGFLVPGNHTVKIEWTGAKSVSTGSTNVNLDAVDAIGVLR
jgi:SpoIID/LytB domain protein